MFKKLRAFVAKRLRQKESLQKHALTDFPHKDDVDFLAALLSFPRLRVVPMKTMVFLALNEAPRTPVVEVLFWLITLSRGCEWMENKHPLSPAARKLILTASVAESLDEKRSGIVVERMMAAIMRQQLRAKTDLLLLDLRRAEKHNNNPRVMAILRERTMLSRLMDSLPNV